MAGVAGTCRHVVPLIAANLVRSGERYAYALGLRILHLYALQPAFIFQDVACKHQSWEAKVQDPEIMGSELYEQMSTTVEQATNVVNVLPEAHATAHSWSCQARISADSCTPLSVASAPLSSGSQCCCMQGLDMLIPMIADSGTLWSGLQGWDRPRGWRRLRAFFFLFLSLCRYYQRDECCW